MSLYSARRRRRERAIKRWYADAPVKKRCPLPAQAAPSQESALGQSLSQEQANEEQAPISTAGSAEQHELGIVHTTSSSSKEHS